MVLIKFPGDQEGAGTVLSQLILGVFASGWGCLPSGLHRSSAWPRGHSGEMAECGVGLTPPHPAASTGRRQTVLPVIPAVTTVALEQCWHTVGTPSVCSRHSCSLARSRLPVPPRAPRPLCLAAPLCGSFSYERGDLAGVTTCLGYCLRASFRKEGFR